MYTRRFCSESIARKINIVIMGPPGGGKGTISKKILKEFNLQHISSGDLLREHVKLQTSIGKTVKEIIDKGNLVPDNIIIDMISQAVKNQPKCNLLDGFPRTEEQAKLVEPKLDIDSVIVLDIPHQVIIQRIANRWIHPGSGRTYSYDYNPPKVLGKDDITGEPLSKRDDDNVDVMTKRLELYEAQSRKLMQFYRKKGILHAFSGTESDVIYPLVREYFMENFPLLVK